MNWIKIESKLDLKKAIDTSSQENLGIAIFKHSTRCSISSVAKTRLSSFWDFNEELPIFFLDLIKFRELSALIAETFDIQHESPQLLVIKNGKCIYDASHMSISVKSLRAELEV